MVVILSKNKENVFGKLNSDIDLLIINYGFYKRNDYVYIEKHFKQISKKLKTSILYLNEKKSFLFDNGHKIAQLEFHNLEIFHIKDYDIIFYTMPLPLMADGVRCMDEQYLKDIHNTFQKYIKQYNINIKYLKGNKEERFNTVVNQIKI